MARSTRDRYRGCLLGLAVGDAVGSAVEGRSRGTFPPVTGMAGGGPFALSPGEWTDGAAMALCLAESLVEQAGFDAADQMDRFVRWWQEGHWSATGACVGIRCTIRGSLERYLESGDPLAGPVDTRAAGNGPIARLAPVALYYGRNREEAVRFAGLSARTTHGTRECIDACRLLGDVLWLALSGADKERALLDHSRKLVKEPRVRAVARGDYRRKTASEVRGSRYVVDSLEAACRCVWSTADFAEAVLAAANLGDDSATTAAVAGQIAGALYGEAAIPERWLAVLARRAGIGAMADALLAGSRTAGRRKRTAPEEALATAS